MKFFDNIKDSVKDDLQQTYKDNYVNNPIATDRLRYDVLFHTDLNHSNRKSNGLDLDRLYPQFRTTIEEWFLYICENKSITNSYQLRVIYIHESRRN
jgi:hypothetical protein